MYDSDGGLEQGLFVYVSAHKMTSAKPIIMLTVLFVGAH